MCLMCFVVVKICNRRSQNISKSEKPTILISPNVPWNYALLFYNVCLLFIMLRNSLTIDTSYKLLWWNVIWCLLKVCNSIYYFCSLSMLWSSKRIIFFYMLRNFAVLFYKRQGCLEAKLWEACQMHVLPIFFIEEFYWWLLTLSHFTKRQNFAKSFIRSINWASYCWCLLKVCTAIC